MPQRCERCGQFKGKLHKCPENVWNKGLTKHIDNRVKTPKTAFKKGHKSYYKGKTLWGENGIFKRPHPQGMLNKRSWNKGKKLHYEVWNKGTKGVMKPNKTSFKRGDTVGKNNINWRNGASFELYGKEFNNDLKLIIRFRDKFTCRLCGFKENGQALDVHHIDYNKKNNSWNNLISLCHNCHMQTNWNRKHWEYDFKEVLLNRFFWNIQAQLQDYLMHVSSRLL